MCYESSRITDPDLYHPNGTQPIFSHNNVFSIYNYMIKPNNWDGESNKAGRWIVVTSEWETIIARPLAF